MRADKSKSLDELRAEIYRAQALNRAETRALVRELFRERDRGGTREPGR